MLIKHHDLEAYYLQRRLELLHILDDFAYQSFQDEDFHMDDDHWQIEILRKEYSDVMDPESLCLALKRIYPDHLFSIESRRNSTKND
jgi:hypothetical protein